LRVCVLDPVSVNRDLGSAVSECRLDAAFEGVRDFGIRGLCRQFRNGVERCAELVVVATTLESAGITEEAIQVVVELVAEDQTVGGFIPAVIVVDHAFRILYEIGAIENFIKRIEQRFAAEGKTHRPAGPGLFFVGVPESGRDIEFFVYLPGSVNVQSFRLGVLGVAQYSGIIIEEIRRRPYEETIDHTHVLQHTELGIVLLVKPAGYKVDGAIEVRTDPDFQLAGFAFVIPGRVKQGYRASVAAIRTG